MRSICKVAASQSALTQTIRGSRARRARSRAAGSDATQAMGPASFFGEPAEPAAGGLPADETAAGAPEPIRMVGGVEPGAGEHAAIAASEAPITSRAEHFMLHIRSLGAQPHFDFAAGGGVGAAAPPPAAAGAPPPLAGAPPPLGTHLPPLAATATALALVVGAADATAESDGAAVAVAGAGVEGSAAAVSIVAACTGDCGGGPPFARRKAPMMAPTATTVPKPMKSGVLFLAGGMEAETTGGAAMGELGAPSGKRPVSGRKLDAEDAVLGLAWAAAARALRSMMPES